MWNYVFYLEGTYVHYNLLSAGVAVAVAFVLAAGGAAVAAGAPFLRWLLHWCSSKVVNKYERLLILWPAHSEDTPLENIPQKMLYLRILHTYSVPIEELYL